MAQKGSRKGQEKVTTRAKRPTSVIIGHLSLGLDRIDGFILEHICRLTRIYNLCYVEDERVWDLFYDIIILDPVTTRHFAQFQLRWPHHRSWRSPFWEWWAAFRSYMGQMFFKIRVQMPNWRWDNPGAYEDRVDRCNPQRSSSRKVIHTGECFRWYGSDDLRANIDPPSCREYKPRDFLVVEPLNLEE
jgi:hypothetical protein